MITHTALRELADHKTISCLTVLNSCANTMNKLVAKIVQCFYGNTVCSLVPF